jgi:hypothetical protein
MFAMQLLTTVPLCPPTRPPCPALPCSAGCAPIHATSPGWRSTPGEEGIWVWGRCAAACSRSCCCTDGVPAASKALQPALPDAFRCLPACLATSASPAPAAQTAGLALPLKVNALM